MPPGGAEQHPELCVLCRSFSLERTFSFLALRHTPTPPRTRGLWYGRTDLRVSSAPVPSLTKRRGL